VGNPLCKIVAVITALVGVITIRAPKLQKSHLFNSLPGDGTMSLVKRNFFSSTLFTACCREGRQAKQWRGESTRPASTPLHYRQCKSSTLFPACRREGGPAKRRPGESTRPASTPIHYRQCKSSTLFPACRREGGPAKRRPGESTRPASAPSITANASHPPTKTNLR
jgi:hypothetical protein